MILHNLPLLVFLPLTVFAQSPPRVTDQAHNITYTGARINGVESFQGIGFGRDTSDADRFKHPKPFSYPSDSTVDATKPGAACP